MGSRSHLLDLMRRREALGARKAAAGLGALAAEQARHSDLADRLTQVIAQTLPGPGPQHPARLRAAMTLAGQLQTQREIATNRAEFLATELEGVRARLGQHQRREALIADRADLARRTEAEAAEARSEASLPPRRGAPRA